MHLLLYNASMCLVLQFISLPTRGCCTTCWISAFCFCCAAVQLLYTLRWVFPNKGLRLTLSLRCWCSWKLKQGLDTGRSAIFKIKTRPWYFSRRFSHLWLWTRLSSHLCGTYWKCIYCQLGCNFPCWMDLYLAWWLAAHWWHQLWWKR